ncbi:MULTISPECIES: biliverdin-producing heme oxygenase [unclassified Pseudomonas]|uniref:biliverdin-producing heme oxygenase n=1 Tax=unclassified Pseudomonas TaxID=196821 RepID=UPI002448ECFC|nr:MULTISPECIES: biliverdin-producing heme oxygenase [unclassified Pseudomonas]MDG9929316.1 biliverdin-producing heme oxygenase [Pseudomonas sp. GD04042]MDH0485740.1 biliverdin-producing heme oxygenase [Pseudomonas sp. GD04015]MDH0606159.1 biliverdin-producing heme oxygenase [Pseudomonas sp. GD03869]
MDSLRQRLKHFSTGLHHQVDAAFSAFPLESAPGYRGFLLAHGAALFSLERTLEANAVEALIEDWPLRRRSDALHADLLALGIEHMAPLDAPRHVDPGWCWGALYVLEGSRLGARLLAQRLRAAQPTAPMSYLGHAAAEGLWPRFLQRLEACAGSCDEAQLQQGVADAFGQFLAAARRQGEAEASLLAG